MVAIVGSVWQQPQGGEGFRGEHDFYANGEKRVAKQTLEVRYGTFWSKP